MRHHSVHFSRCHHCGHVTKKEGARVEHCDHCSKPIARFYYFNERFTAVLSEHTLRPPKLQNEYTPIYGLTAYWENF